MNENHYQYFLKEFNKLLVAQTEHGPDSAQVEAIRKKIGPALKGENGFFEWLWERI